MSVRSATARVRRPAPPRVVQGPTPAQADALNRLMRKAHRDGDLWSWRTGDDGVVLARVCRGARVLGAAAYAPAEIAALGERWPADVMAKLTDLWAPSMAQGLK